MSSPRSGTGTWLILLRGINVGGQRVIPMSDLREVFAEMGFDDPVTYIQSGNVVLRSRSADAQAVAAKIEGAVAEEFGVPAKVVVRTPGELVAVAAADPFPRTATCRA